MYDSSGGVIPRLLFGCVAATALTAGTGCAGVEYQSVPYHPIPTNPDGTEDPQGAAAARAENVAEDEKRAVTGIRYYDTSLYLIVNSNGKGGVQWRLVELPDATKKRTAEPYNVAAQLESSLVFKNGTLVGTKEKVDETAVPRAAVEAVTKVVGSLAKAFLTARGGPGPDGTYSLPPVEVYKVVYRDGAWELNGGPGDARVSITLVTDNQQGGNP